MTAMDPDHMARFLILIHLHLFPSKQLFIVSAIWTLVPGISALVIPRDVVEPNQEQSNLPFGVTPKDLAIAGGAGVIGLTVGAGTAAVVAKIVAIRRGGDWEKHGAVLDCILANLKLTKAQVGLKSMRLTSQASILEETLTNIAAGKQIKIPTRISQLVWNEAGRKCPGWIEEVHGSRAEGMMLSPLTKEQRKELWESRKQKAREAKEAKNQPQEFSLAAAKNSLKETTNLALRSNWRHHQPSSICQRKCSWVRRTASCRGHTFLCRDLEDEERID
ncbi:MAG: hypothetical protein M1816_001307 [Peltula sp. TS41687]|nr:MAG: hypothetical protein M1816_001307 [Peltula sp. TS41687]